MSARRLPQVKHDETYGPLMVIARVPQLATWKECADRAEMSLSDWATDRLDRCALLEKP